jgi:RHS repeat-associated protein
VTFAYDGEAHRTQIVETAAGGGVTTTDFRYQGDAVVEESVNGSAAREFTVNDTGRIATMTIPSGGSAGTYLVTWNGHGDALGLWKENADGSLTLTNSFVYDTWGKSTLTVAGGFADLGFSYRYVGAFDVQTDDALGMGLLYMHARHYSPLYARFLEPDPARADASLYEYGANGPVTNVDPDGHCIQFIWAYAAGPPGWVLGTASIGSCLLLLLAVGILASKLVIPLQGDAWWKSGPARSTAARPVESCWRYCWLIAQRVRKQLEGLRNARRNLQDRLERGRGTTGQNNWERNLRGIEEQLRDLLRRNPQLRKPGDP